MKFLVFRFNFSRPNALGETRDFRQKGAPYRFNLQLACRGFGEFLDIIRKLPDFLVMNSDRSKGAPRNPVPSRTIQIASRINLTDHSQVIPNRSVISSTAFSSRSTWLWKPWGLRDPVSLARMELSDLSISSYWCRRRSSFWCRRSSLRSVMRRSSVSRRSGFSIQVIPPPPIAARIDLPISSISASHARRLHLRRMLPNAKYFSGQNSGVNSVQTALKRWRKIAGSTTIAAWINRARARATSVSVDIVPLRRFPVFQACVNCLSKSSPVKRVGVARLRLQGYGRPDFEFLLLPVSIQQIYDLLFGGQWACFHGTHSLTV